MVMNHPDVSVGICCYNEERNIALLLNNLLKEQSLTNNSEIIVVCSGCTDKTPELVEGFSKIDRRVKVIIETERRGKASALNKILKVYRNSFLVCIDADHIPEKNTLSFLLYPFKDPKIGIVSGYHFPINGNKGLMKSIGTTIMSIHNYMRKYCMEHGINQQYGDVFWSMRRGVCDNIPEDIISEDAYIGVECQRKGFKMYLEERAFAYFLTPQTLPEYITQRRRFIFANLLIKKRTGVQVEVLASLPLKHKFSVFFSWLVWNLYSIPHLTAIILLELYITFLAHLDMRKRQHAIYWTMAKSTKAGIA